MLPTIVLTTQANHETTKRTTPFQSLLFAWLVRFLVCPVYLTPAGRLAPRPFYVLR